MQLMLSQTRITMDGARVIGDVEVGVEGGDLIDLGQRHPHLVRECGQMGRGDAEVAILDEVEVLDQQIPAARLVGEEV